MKLGTEDKKKLRVASVVGVLALVALVVIYNELFGAPSTPPPAPAVVTAPAPGTAVPGKTASTPPGFAVGRQTGTPQKLGSAGNHLDPTLHMAAMLATESLVYTGSGRNIFSGGPSAPPPTAIAIAKPIAPARPPVPMPLQTAVNTGPPPPPPINLKFFGTATSANGSRKAFLINGDDVFLASVGDIVQRKYRVVSIAANSILVEDIPNSNKQTLPLVVN